MVDVAVCPCAALTLLGLADMEKSLVWAPHPANLNDPIRVLQLKVPLEGRYSLTYQKVQSSAGSTDISE